MNLVRRIVRKAESDHYALYRAYKLLKECGYTKTLLGLSMSEHDSSCVSLDPESGASFTPSNNSTSYRGSTSSSGSNSSFAAQELMGDDVISILLEHLPEDTPFPDCATSPGQQQIPFYS